MTIKSELRELFLTQFEDEMTNETKAHHAKQDALHAEYEAAKRALLHTYTTKSNDESMRYSDIRRAKWNAYTKEKGCGHLWTD